MAQYKTYRNLGNPQDQEPTRPCMEIQDLEHRKKILTENNVVCIDLWGEWCGPCKVVAPKFAKLAEKL